MSYDIYLKRPAGGICACPHCGQEYTPTTAEYTDFTANYTSNVYQIWQDALGCDLASLQDKPPAEVGSLLKAAVLKAKQPEVKRRYQEIQDKANWNGWGTWRGAIDFLQDILSAWEKNPECTLDISH